MMWKCASQALAGVLVFGSSVPDELGTISAFAEFAAAAPASVAMLAATNVRRVMACCIEISVAGWEAILTNSDWR
jgi:hypothetical protein